MPTPLHQTLISLFADRPQLALELASGVLGRGPAAVATHDLSVFSADVSTLRPTEFRADLVLHLPDPDDAQRSLFSLIVEIQLARDPEKRFSWPCYAANLRAARRCPQVWLLVVAPDVGVAKWCRRPIEMAPGSTFTPLVVEPKDIPRVADLDEADDCPELAVLSALTRPTDVKAAQAAFFGAAKLEGERSTAYSDILFSVLGVTARRALEQLMAIRQHEFQSDFAKKYFAEGLSKGLDAALIAVLTARGLAPSPTVRERIHTCGDAEQLEQWLSAAATADTFDDVFGGE